MSGSEEARGVEGLGAALTVLHGVGSERAAVLERLGLRRVEDLLLYGPRRYEDRSRFQSIREIAEKGLATVRARVVACGVKWFRNRSRSVFQMVLEDGTGRLDCRWWNMPYLATQYAAGDELLVHGRVVELKPRTIDHPEVEVVEEGGDEPRLHMGRIVPVYSLTEGVTQRWLRGRVWEAVERFVDAVPEPRPGLACGGLPTRAWALRRLHFPDVMDDVEAARRRLAFDEWVEFQFEIQGRRRRLRSRGGGPRCDGDNRWMRPFLAGLPYRLTEGQTAVLREIRHDLVGGEPMRRLLQGDVGSGKTVVAAAAALMALESGRDVALMAPTEILARQHRDRFREWFGPLGIAVRLRIGGGKVESDEGAGAGPGDGGAPGEERGPELTIGTHALLEDAYAPERLGLVIIDEQHRFGVVQRERLVRKGRCPHLLVMTATPIPRTLALTLYGDLDVSVLNESPPGRGRVRTYVRSRDRLPKVWEFVRGKVAEGRQAYVIYARVESEDGAEDIKSVTREVERLREILTGIRVGWMHGRLGTEEKDAVMHGFRSGHVDLLVATSVVEVGVDVPNATVMVIEDAERFGLAQLHQMRGRIGRGGHDGYCILVPGRENDEGRRRLSILEESADGFRIAEADLALRGPGELLGQAQSGLPPLRFADLTGDRELLEMARLAVGEYLAGGVAGSAASGKGPG